MNEYERGEVRQFIAASREAADILRERRLELEAQGGAD